MSNGDCHINVTYSGDLGDGNNSVRAIYLTSYVPLVPCGSRVLSFRPWIGP